MPCLVAGFFRRAASRSTANTRQRSFRHPSATSWKPRATPRDTRWGLQWGLAMAGGRNAFRVQTEHTFLERSTTFRDRPVGTYYTSRAVPQGYTNQGRVLGAGIGSQGRPVIGWPWITSVQTGKWGLFGERIRWNHDALWDVPLITPFALLWCKHDVTIRGGIRGVATTPIGRFQRVFVDRQEDERVFSTLHPVWEGRRSVRAQRHHQYDAGVEVFAPLVQVDTP